MKRIIKCLYLMIIVLSGCRQEGSSFPPEFKGHNNNPVVTPGEPGSWDDQFVIAPQVVFYKNIFYLFYMGVSVSGRMAVGLATSSDGLNFTKFAGNPVLESDGSGFDAFSVGPGIILKEDSTWVMYYTCQELAGYTPGRSVGRATAKQLTGPWLRGDAPVIMAGKKGEWDDGFIIPSSVLKLGDGSYRLYYSGGREITDWKDFYIGMAVSEDGITWKKYNDPATGRYPFLESDPVFLTGKKGEWDETTVWMASIGESSAHFRMYYTGSKEKQDAIGYATSPDGIHWERYEYNPVYCAKDDPSAKNSADSIMVENPFVLNLDTIYFLYYDTGTSTGTICVATAPGSAH